MVDVENVYLHRQQNKCTELHEQSSYQCLPKLIATKEVEIRKYNKNNLVERKRDFLPSKTSGAIQAALPLLLVMWVCASQAVPKSQIFKSVPRATSSKLQQRTGQVEYLIGQKNNKGTVTNDC